MTFQTVTLQVPQSIYQSAWRTARAVKRPIEDFFVMVLKSSLPSLEGLPQKTVAELTALESCTDKQLLGAARSTLSIGQRRQLSRLLQKNQAGKLTKRERQKLDDLIAASDQLMLRRARAYVLLKWRGYAPAMTIEREHEM